MRTYLNKAVAALGLMCALILPAAAQVQGAPLNSGATPKVVWSKNYSAYYGQTPQLNFESTADTFYQVEVFSLGRAARMNLTDLGGRSRAYSDHTSRQGSHNGQAVYKSSFAYNPQYAGRYNLRFSGSPGQRFTYRVTKWRLAGKPSGLAVNRSRQQGRGRQGQGRYIPSGVGGAQGRPSGHTRSHGTIFGL